MMVLIVPETLFLKLLQIFVTIINESYEEILYPGFPQKGS